MARNPLGGGRGPGPASAPAAASAIALQTVKLYDIDFTEMSQTWASTGEKAAATTNYPSLVLNANILAASSSWVADSGGLYVSGGTGECGIKVKMSTLPDWDDFNGSEDGIVYGAILEADGDDGTWAISMGSDGAHRFLLYREQDLSQLRLISYLASTFDTDRTFALGGSAVRSIGMMMTRRSFQGWYQTSSPTDFPWEGNLMGMNGRQGNFASIVDGTGPDLIMINVNNAGVRNIKLTRLRLFIATPTVTSLQTE